MTQPAPEPQKMLDIGNQIRERSGISVEDLMSFPQTDHYIDLRGSRWALGKGPPVANFAGHTVLYIAEDDGDVRVYGAPTVRPNMSAVEQKALKEHEGVFIIWTMRRDVGTFSAQLLLDPGNFCALVAKEMRDAFDAFAEDVLGGSEADDMLEYLKGLPAGTSLADAIKGIEAGDHEEEEEKPEPSPQPTA